MSEPMTRSGGSGMLLGPLKNVNFTFDKAGFARRYPEHPGANKQLFFFATPRQQNNQIVLRHQRRFVDKLLDRSCRKIMCCSASTTKRRQIPPELNLGPGGSSSVRLMSACK